MKSELNFKFIFDESNGILFKYYYGSIKIDDISSSWEYAIKNGLIPKELNGFILDYREASLDIIIRDYMKIPAFYKKHVETFKNYKIALVVEKPKDIVVTILVKEKDDGYFSQPFSTIEAAIQWVLNDITPFYDII
jgi:hypothetical protein